MVWIQNFVVQAVRVEILEALVILKTERQNVVIIAIFIQLYSFHSETMTEPLQTDIFVLPVAFHVQELESRIKNNTRIKSWYFHIAWK